MKMKQTLLALSAAILLNTSANAAIEINEEDFGPTYGSAMADVLIAKPLQVVGAVLGTATHIIGLPFSIASDSVDSSYDVLVDQPWNALSRCVGCSEAYDNYRYQTDSDALRIVVDRPSEIIINTNNEVVVNPQ